MHPKPKVLVILGPTSSGKTALSIELAKRFNGEVISADSRQVYRGLNLCSGKVTTREMQHIPHHLLDVASPKRVFSAGNFVEKARKSIDDCVARGTLPIICGGTGFYIDALVGRIVLPEVPPNPALRKELEGKTADELFTLLQKEDPVRAETIEPKHARRIIRALEIARALGASPQPTHDIPYDVLWVGLAPSEKVLHEKIHTRLLARMRAGMVAEAKKLHAAGLSYKRMEELGLECRSLAQLLRGIVTKDEMLAELESAIKLFAKRQMRYWRRNTEIQWFDPRDNRIISACVQKWLSH